MKKGKNRKHNEDEREIYVPYFNFVELLAFGVFIIDLLSYLK